MEATSDYGAYDSLENVQHRDRVQQLQARLASMRSAQTPANRHHVEDLLAQVRIASRPVRLDCEWCVACRRACTIECCAGSPQESMGVTAWPVEGVARRVL